MNRRLALLSAVLGLVSCYSSFVRNDGPVTAAGVTVSLVGQRCSAVPDINADVQSSYYLNRLDLGLRVAIENETPDTITVQPGNLRLVAGLVMNAPVEAPQTLTVAPGARAQVDLHFKRVGGESCDTRLSLALTKAVLDGARPVELPAVSFVAAS